MNGIIIAALIGLAGIVIAAILSSVAYFAKTRLEAKKTTRKVLYWLLEIRHAIKTSCLDSAELMHEYLEYCRDKMVQHNIASDDEIPPEIKNLMLEHFKSVIELVRTDLNDRLLDPYEKALLDLSEVDPVLASKLRGEEKLTSLVQLANQYHNDFSELIVANISTDYIREPIASFADRARKQAIDDLVQELEQDILEVARRNGRGELARCRNLIADTHANKQYDFGKVGLLLDEIFFNIESQER